MFIKMDEDTTDRLWVQLTSWGLVGLFVLAETILALFTEKSFSIFNIGLLVIIALWHCYNEVVVAVLILQGIYAKEEEEE